MCGLCSTSSVSPDCQQMHHALDAPRVKEMLLLYCSPSPSQLPLAAVLASVTFTDEQYVVVAESNRALAPEAANLVDADTIGTDCRDLTALINICTQTTSITIPGRQK